MTLPLLTLPLRQYSTHIQHNPLKKHKYIIHYIDSIHTVNKGKNMRTMENKNNHLSLTFHQSVPSHQSCITVPLLPRVFFHNAIATQTHYVALLNIMKWKVPARGLITVKNNVGEHRRTLTHHSLTRRHNGARRKGGQVCRGAVCSCGRVACLLLFHRCSSLH